MQHILVIVLQLSRSRQAGRHWQAHTLSVAKRVCHVKLPIVKRVCHVKLPIAKRVCHVKLPIIS